jgi:hypothetical protein
MRIAAIAAVTMLVTVPVLADWDDDCKYTAPRRAATPVSGITKVVVHAESGSLTVEGVPGASQIIAAGTACTSEQDFLPRMNLTLRKVGSELHVEADIPDKTVIFGFFSARLDFAITLPQGLPVTIDDSSGWIRISNTGATTIDDDSGAIEARNILGALTIHDDSGAIEVDTVRGEVTIEDDSGEITVRNVSGAVEIEDDSGAITVSRIDGALHIRDDDSGAITAEHVRGAVTIDNDGSGAIEVADVGGAFTVRQKGSGSIDYVRVAGRVSIPERD